jgi:hypothetical protein
MRVETTKNFGSAAKSEMSVQSFEQSDRVAGRGGTQVRSGTIMLAMSLPSGAGRALGAATLAVAVITTAVSTQQMLPSGAQSVDACEHRPTIFDVGRN